MRRFLKGLAFFLIVAIGGIIFWGYAADVPVNDLRTKYANAESEFVDLGDGLTVHLRDEGPKDAPAIILLHGSNASLHTWQQWVDRLGSAQVMAVADACLVGVVLFFAHQLKRRNATDLDRV